MKFKFLKRIYILAAIAIAFALAKYVFLDQIINTRFYIFEFISFLVFLFIIYLIDKDSRNKKKQQEVDANNLEKLKNDYEEKLSHLTFKLNELISSQKKGSEVVSETETLIKNLEKELAVNIDDSVSIQEHFLHVLAHYFEIVLGIYYTKEELSGNYAVKGSYGLKEDYDIPVFSIGDGLHSQVVKDGDPLVINEVDDDYFAVESCSGSAKPKNVYFLPIKRNGEVLGLIEIASFKSINIIDYWESINEFFVNSDLI